MKEIPNAIRQGGVRQLANAYKTNFAKFKGTGKAFEIQFRNKKKLLSETIELDKRSTCFIKNKKKRAKVSLLPRALGSPLKLSDSKKTIKKLLKWKSPPMDYKIQYYRRTDDWFLLVPEEVEPVVTPPPKHDAVALDPGVRSFMTAYSPTAGAGKFPVGGLDKTKELLTKIDALTGYVAKLKPLSPSKRVVDGRTYGKNSIKNRMRLIHRTWCKIRNIRHHLHYTIANFLLKNFAVVLLPKFATKDMTKKEGRVIGKRTARDMLTWSHFQFQQRLLWKAKQKANSKVVVVEEHLHHKSYKG